MAEYINRERARFEAERYFKNMVEIQDELDMLFCMLPAENVFPVRNGRWLYHTLIDGYIHAECSECHKIRIIDNYCPNCGARMDGDSENG